MLNECFSLSRSMADAGIELSESWHKAYVRCPKNSVTFQLSIDRKGHIVDLQRIDDTERVQAIRKYEVANGLSFPAFNALPLFHCDSRSEDPLCVRIHETVPCH